MHETLFRSALPQVATKRPAPDNTSRRPTSTRTRRPLGWIRCEDGRGPMGGRSGERTDRCSKIGCSELRNPGLAVRRPPRWRMSRWGFRKHDIDQETDGRAEAQDREPQGEGMRPPIANRWQARNVRQQPTRIPAPDEARLRGRLVRVDVFRNRNRNSVPAFFAHRRRREGRYVDRSRWRAVGDAIRAQPTRLPGGRWLAPGIRHPPMVARVGATLKGRSASGPAAEGAPPGLSGGSRDADLPESASFR